MLFCVLLLASVLAQSSLDEFVQPSEGFPAVTGLLKKMPKGSTKCDSKYWCPPFKGHTAGGTCCKSASGHSSTNHWYCTSNRTDICSMGQAGPYPYAYYYNILCQDTPKSTSYVCYHGQNCNYGKGCQSNPHKPPAFKSLSFNATYQLGQDKTQPGFQWEPSTSRWKSDVLYNIATRMHGEFLPYWSYGLNAGKYRSSATIIQDCWVVGFPKDLTKCTQGRLDEKGCTKDNAKLVQVGEMYYGNAVPTITAAVSQPIHWCNNSPLANVHEATYSEKVTNSYTVSVTAGIKTTTEVSSTSEMEVNMVGAKGKESVTVKASLEVDFSKSNAQTTSVDQEFTSKQTTNVPAMSVVDGACYIEMGRFDTPWVAKYKVDGPIVWSCRLYDPAISNYYSWYNYPTNTAVWNADGFARMMTHYGFDKDYVQDRLSVQVSGIMQASKGQAVKCFTNVRKLEPGEQCSGGKLVKVNV